MNILYEKRRAMGWHARCSDAPDMSGANAAAMANAELAKESLAFYKQIYAEQAPARERATNTALQVADAQLASMEQQAALSKEYADYNRETFRPVEQQVVADAMAYDTPDRREAEAGQAVADVGIQAANARQAQTRAQTRMGVNPNSGAATSMQSALSLGEAAAKAGAGNTARKNVETIGFARKMDAAGLGRNLASNSSTAASVALNAGNSATGNASVPVQQAQSAASMMGQGFSTAIQGNNSAGGLYTQAAQISSQDSGLMGALGGVAGSFLGGQGFAKMIPSDENIKEGVKPVSDEQALDAIEKTPVSSWKYKPGEGDGGEHVGPMAQHVQKTMGDKAAPGGKQIDLITMNGVTMAGMAALSRKVDKLTKKVEGAKA